MTGNPPFLEASHAIGRRLARRAQWSGGRCTWQVVVPAVRDGRTATCAMAARGDLYGGSSGVALFLGRLHAATGDRALARVAEGAVLHALEWAAALPEDAFGLFTGRVGVAHAAVQLAEALGREELAARAGEILAPLAGQEHRDEGLDVVGGAAGAIPALLSMARALGDPGLRGAAERLGDRLVAAAEHEPAGWSWRTLPIPVFRNLTGLAHGTSGIGLGLLELFAETAVQAYAFAALEAFRYERSHFCREAGNWPDFRREGHPAPPSSRTRPYTPRFRHAWCNGAAGIGLARLRAYELLGDPACRREAEAALAATLGVLRSAGDWCFCHGTAGRCWFLLRAAALPGRSGVGEVVRATVAEGIERYGRPRAWWPGGTVPGAWDPSLMLGEAGVGMLLLALSGADAAFPPSPVPEKPGPPAPPDPDERCRALRVRHFGRYFGRTLHLLSRRFADPGDPGGGVPVLELEDVPALSRWLRRAIGQARDADLAEAYRLERLALELLLDHRDPLRDDPAEPPPFEEIRHEPLRLSPSARLLRCRRDWAGWEPEAGALSPSTGAVLLVSWREARVRVQRLGALAAPVLQCFRTPRTPDRAVDRVARRLAAGAGDDGIRARALAQVEAAYRARVLVRAGGDAPRR